MAATAQDLIDQFKRAYPDCPDTLALSLVQDVDIEIFNTVPWRQTQVNVALVASQQQYQISESVMRVTTARLLQANASQYALIPTSIDGLDLNPQAGQGVGPSWRNTTPGTPTAFYTATDMTGSTVGVWPTSQFSTLLISGATNANPIVITTTTDHGLSTGDLVAIYDVLGNTAANTPNLVDTYETITVLTATTFSIPVAGNAPYVSGGKVLATNSPMMILDVVKRIDYDTDTDIPATPAISRVYVSGMCYLYARMRDQEKTDYWKAMYDKDIAEQNAILQGMNEKLQPRIQIVRQRPGGPAGFINWRC